MQKILSISAEIMILMFGMAYGEAGKDKVKTDRFIRGEHYEDTEINLP
jgi:hypothetical protein